MVLEQAFRGHWQKRRKLSAFLIGVLYSVIGIIFAKFIFGSSAGVMSVAFISILLLPSISVFLRQEENVEIREKKFSIKLLFKDHKDIFEIYFFLFLGIFLTYAVIAAFFPQQTVINLFKAQLTILANFRGYAVGFDNTLWSIMLNNMKIMAVCFIMSFVYGAGGILLIVWNASVWGSIMGFIVSESVVYGQGNPVSMFFIVFLPLLPHMVIEVTSYFCAAISGGVLSKATLREKVGSKKFHHVITDGVMFIVIAMLLVIIGAMVEVWLFPLLAS